ncbi:MAG: GtrA family protein [Methylobacteriaceae bacterium]|nr:GtrA family protein [Methylobacteriaceae bacterium]
MAFLSTDDALAPPRRRALTTFVKDAIGYGAASVVALAVDWGMLVALVRLAGAHYLVASGVAFMTGLAVAYALSTAFVFKGRAKYGAGVEFVGFLVTGLLGLALNQALLYVFVGKFGAPVEFAKAPTAGFVFSFNFLTRRLLLFSAKSA